MSWKPLAPVGAGRRLRAVVKQSNAHVTHSGDVGWGGQPGRSRSTDWGQTEFLLGEDSSVLGPVAFEMARSPDWVGNGSWLDLSASTKKLF